MNFTYHNPLNKPMHKQIKKPAKSKGLKPRHAGRDKQLGKGNKPAAKKPAKKDKPEPKPLAVIEVSKRPAHELGAEHLKPRADGTGVEIIGKPTPGEFVVMIAAGVTSTKLSQFIVGDLLNAAGKMHPDQYDAILAATKVDRRTLDNWKSIAKSIAPAVREPSLDFSIHKAVAALPDKDQRKLLNEAAEKHLTVKDVVAEVKKINPPKKKPTRTATNTLEIVDVVGEERKAAQNAALKNARDLSFFLNSDVFDALSDSEKTAWELELRTIAKKHGELAGK